MANINAFYPPSGGAGSNASVSTNGTAIPGSSTLVAGENPSLNLQPLQTDPSGYLYVNAQSSALPTGAATAANQVTQEATLTAIQANQTNGTQHTIVDSSALPSGASTSALQTTGNTSLATIATNTPAVGQKAMAASTPVTIASDQSSIPVTIASGSSTIGKVDQGAANTAANGWPVKITDGTNTGTVKAASTAAVAADTAQVVALSPNNNTLANALLTKTTDGTNTAAVKAASTAAATTDPALVVAISPNGTTPKASGRSLANAPTVTTYGTPVTSGAYVTIIASTTSATNLVELFDSSGVALYFAVGGAGSEINQFVIYPGGNGQVPLAIPAGSRISYKAVSTSATGASAFNVLNLYT